MAGAFDPKYRKNNERDENILRAPGRFSISFLIESAAIPGALIVCILALVFLLFALMEFASGSELNDEFAGAPALQLGAWVPAPVGPTPFTYNSDWNLVNVTTTGLQRVNASNFGSVSSANVRVFYAGGEPLPEYNNVAPPSLIEIPIKMFDGGDGTFSGNDYFLFYGESANRWKYEAGQAPQFIRNIFTNDNNYWLATGGAFPGAALRMSAVDGTISGGETAVTSFRRQARVESDQLLTFDNLNDIQNFYDWFWSNSSTHSLTLNTPGAINDATQDDTVRFVSGALAQNSIGMNLNGVSLGSIPMTQRDRYTTSVPSLRDGANSVSYALAKGTRGGPFFDFVEVDYLSALRLYQGQLDFNLPNRTGAHSFSVSGASANLITLKINNPSAPEEITGGALAGGFWSFAANLDGATVNRFFVADPALATVPTISSTTTTDLRADTTAAVEYFILAPRVWQNDLARYVAHRESFSGINARLVAIEDIVNEFGYGSLDPSAIRNYLKYAFENCDLSGPATVLLVGDGTHDFRGLISDPDLNIIPPYVRSAPAPSSLNRYPERGYISDDSYVYFGDFGFMDSDGDHIDGVVFGVDMVPARWSVRNRGELNGVIDKIIDYEVNPEFGSWRSRVSLLADDEFGSSGFAEKVHVIQTEDLERFHLPGYFLRNKIYLWDYPLNSLQERPQVNDAIVRAFNEGSLVLNYIGHGNPELLADERVFTSSSDLPRLQNGKRTPLMFTASCSIGFFDDPSREGMAEELFRMPGGAIAVVSATRLVYSSANARFNWTAYDQLFSTQNLTAGQAVFAAKLSRQNINGVIDNDRRYAFFGDPYLRLSAPKRKINFTTQPDSLLALTPTTISGDVVDGDGVLQAGFSGSAEITVYDSKFEQLRQVLHPLTREVVDTVLYDVNGPVLFRGSTAVTNGQFSLTFVPSLDVGFGADAAMISVYVSNPNEDGAGTLDSLPIGATIPAVTDVTGPTVDLIFPERNKFISGDRIGPNEPFIIRLTDESGINLSDAFGHGVSLTVDDSPVDRTLLTSAFTYDAGSYTTGEIYWSMADLTDGQHSFTILVWDNANNSTTLIFSAEVSSETAPAISELMNYPNPLRDQTGFFFTLNAPAERMLMQVYTLSGAKIYETEERSLPQGYNDNRFIWDGRDLDGDRVASGVYLYRTVMYPASPGDAVEEFGKLVVVN